ncbi:hypothetical protein [Acidaminobacter hydrogenoformans]|uniref:hypothetical protein n=1 Tax=Acidaminobacter hydrogenoformans TaxID=65403 RepID=UPI00111331B4|nr:hypothetical protein [Acidaminobacter hydrogenoformans]
MKRQPLQIAFTSLNKSLLQNQNTLTFNCQHHFVSNNCFFRPYSIVFVACVAFVAFVAFVACVACVAQFYLKHASNFSGIANTVTLLIILVVPGKTYY